MSRTRHTLSKADLLQYALEGTSGAIDQFRRTDYRSLAEADAAFLRLLLDKAEIERRMKLVEIQAKRRPHYQCKECGSTGPGVHWKDCKLLRMACT